MGKLIAIVVAFGVLIGLALPTGKPIAAPATATGAAKEVVLTRGSTGHFFTDATINDRGSVEFMVDTGASFVALTVEDARRLGVDIDPANFDVIAEGASGPVRGEIVTLKSVEVGGIRAENVRAMVLEGSRLSLLGQSFLARVDQVNMAGDYLSLHDAG
ncbi:TIGR02281 family clan AA aspartic protease [Sphingomonas rhizophila]|uniref:TIGR02281 family clan AA aspartic protease n=1 Tax=Sphingomonas rhizophila TaxID=2071607 RepID=A0A7G9SAS3_9SPHN|nr:TIGR02281 family clan AA aspartic protease [Sphingomonas rhizophila]QNN64948.1 TIGR02281 family clan AA aspartic protease [Sphingomonas rhizophila]